jgi:hypothetical protein
MANVTSPANVESPYDLAEQGFKESEKLRSGQSLKRQIAKKKKKESSRKKLCYIMFYQREVKSADTVLCSLWVCGGEYVDPYYNLCGALSSVIYSMARARAKCTVKVQPQICRSLLTKRACGAWLRMRLTSHET